MCLNAAVGVSGLKVAKTRGGSKQTARRARLPEPAATAQPIPLSSDQNQRADLSGREADGGRPENLSYSLLAQRQGHLGPVRPG